ncbi:hypothetical protein [Sanguibacter sp. Leaf3]|jgi:hypothetical protein|uniref:hypothetical protein n=1 Tax=Sanguibacter sp. Leaf3 TaxID=1736209 RepID=UPI0006F99A14|nr:hypothetical protein [Sanguibacter sp. Leaf3]KQT96752.1 hypothetical protein ASG53_17085 [Sanguibacter sp. Leaf3]
MRCDQCDRKITGPPVKTATRTLCARCGDTLDGLTAGVLAGGDVGGAIATAGWYTSLRERRREAQEKKRRSGS